MSKYKYKLGALAIGLLFCIVSAPSWAASGGLFSKSCLTGRYVMATTAFDVSNNNTPFAVTGFVNLNCTGTRQGTYTGQFFATYPGVTPPPVCNISNGTYTIDPNTGQLTSQSTLTDVFTGSCAAFGNKTLSEYGYLSDPTAKQFYQVETGQNGGDTMHFIWTKSQ